jgi:hypothetical protein
MRGHENRFDRFCSAKGKQEFDRTIGTSMAGQQAGCRERLAFTQPDGKARTNFFGEIFERSTVGVERPENPMCVAARKSSSMQFPLESLNIVIDEGMHQQNPNDKTRDDYQTKARTQRSRDSRFRLTLSERYARERRK